jgi:chromosome segregation ATPase
MPRGRRRSSTDVNALEAELQQLKQRQSELRTQIRRLRSSGSEIRKLEEKLDKQLAVAKWTANEIKEVQPDWNEITFYESVQPRKPTPRGRRPRSATPEA